MSNRLIISQFLSIELQDIFNKHKLHSNGLNLSIFLGFAVTKEFSLGELNKARTQSNFLTLIFDKSTSSRVEGTLEAKSSLYLHPCSSIWP